MSAVLAFFRASGDCSAYAGAPLAIQLGEADDTGTQIDITGRAYAMRALVRSTREVIEQSIATANGLWCPLSFSGAQMETIFEASLNDGLGIELVEVLADLSVRPLSVGLLTVRSRGAALTGGASPIADGSDVQQLVFQAAAQTVIIRNMGAPGLDPWQKLVIDGVIAEATSAAFVAWLTGLINNLAAPSLDLSDPDNSAGKISQL